MINNTNFKPYDRATIEVLLKEPWEVSDRPYMLHAAYALSNLFDLCCSDETDTESTPESIWGCKVEQRLLDKFVKDIMDDFNDAASKYKPIKIWGRGYTIRKVNAYEKDRLQNIFNFPLSDGEYIIVPEGVINLQHTADATLQRYEVTKEQARQNRTYLRQIIKLAEDDAHNGWDRLTDIEIVIYCWALFYNKYQYDNFLHFKTEYKDYLYVAERDILECLNEKSSLRGMPVGMYAFSFEKSQHWNMAHRQCSVATDIPVEIADNYWYDVALKKTFKPIDLR